MKGKLRLLCSLSQIHRTEPVHNPHCPLEDTSTGGNLTAAGEMVSVGFLYSEDFIMPTKVYKHAKPYELHQQLNLSCKIISEELGK